ncbi:MAG: hypothetical protein AAGI52_12330 [Bacteroidota bacterium]
MYRISSSLLASVLFALFLLPQTPQAQVSTFDEVRVEDGIRVGDTGAAPTAIVDIVKESNNSLSPFAISRTGAGNQNNRFRFSLTGNTNGLAPGSLFLIADQKDADFAVTTDQSSIAPQFLVKSDGTVGQLEDGSFGSLADGNQWVATGLAPVPFGGGLSNPYGLRLQADSDFALLQLVTRGGKSTSNGERNAELAWGNDTNDSLKIVFIGTNNARTTVASFTHSGSSSFARGSQGGLFSVNGDISTQALELKGGSDIAEPFDIADSPVLMPGMVVAIDAEAPGALRVADTEYDRTVAGIVSGAGGIQPGLTLRQEGTIADGQHPVALTGRVYAYADASNGSIQPGDLLTTSNTPGHAMRATDADRAQGAILGKAMTPLEEGTGLVLVLVSLQ